MLFVFFALFMSIAIVGCEDKRPKAPQAGDIPCLEDLAAKAQEESGELHKAEEYYKKRLDTYRDPPESWYEDLHRVQQKIKDKYGE
jgi:hypothetical protein